MRLRGRFTLAFGAAALVPIAVAALVTREVVARSARDAYRNSRVAIEQSARAAVGELEHDVERRVEGLANPSHPLIGGVLSELVKGGGSLDQAVKRRLKDEVPAQMKVIDADVLTVTGPGKQVLIAPHDRAAIDDVDPEPSARAKQLDGRAYFTFEKILPGDSYETVLIAAAAKSARYEGQEVAVLVGRRVTPELLARVRRTGLVDARLVLAAGGPDAGKELMPPAENHWREWTTTPPIRVPLTDANGTPLAWIEVAVSDGNLEALLLRVTLVSAILAAAALTFTVMLGVLVARRMTRDLDRLAEGAQAAARGDLEHRVPVTSKDEVGEVASALNLMMEDLRTSKERLVIAERIAAWQEIARRLAHEIKNPLTPIQMSMDTLRKTWKKKHPSFDEILEESTTTVLEEARRLGRIVSEFSEFARMPKPELKSVELNEVVAGALGLYHGATPVERRLADGLAPIEADRDQLSQVLINLLENARDAIASAHGEGGRIVVSTRRGDAGDRVEISVEDNGPGVPTELKDRVFAPYFTTKQGKGGTGLGLAIVHRIVSDHGGRITVSDVAGGGARFVVELPFKQGAPLLASRLTQSDAPRPPAKPTTP